VAVCCFRCGVACLLLSLSLTVLYSVRLRQFIVPCLTYLGNIFMNALLIFTTDVDLETYKCPEIVLKCAKNLFLKFTVCCLDPCIYHIFA